MTSKRELTNQVAGLEAMNRGGKLERDDLSAANKSLYEQVGKLRGIITFLMDEFHPNPEDYHAGGLFLGYDLDLLAKDIEFEKEQRARYDAFLRMWGLDEGEPAGLRLVEDDNA